MKPNNGAGHYGPAAPLHRERTPMPEENDERSVLGRMFDAQEAQATRAEAAAVRQTEAIREMGREVGGSLNALREDFSRSTRQVTLVAIVAPLIVGLVICCAALGVAISLRSTLGSIETSHSASATSPAVP